MRRLTILCTVLALSLAGAGGTAWAGNIHLAQSSTVTNCMMACNAQAATCQVSCVVPGTAPTGAATTTSNANVSTTCQLSCTTTQVACQAICARTSPSP
jgi:hypothetical protein